MAVALTPAEVRQLKQQAAADKRSVASYTAWLLRRKAAAELRSVSGYVGRVIVEALARS